MSEHLELGSRHLDTAIRARVLVDHVLTDEWQTAREMYPKFVKEMETRTKIEPVLGNNFKIHLRKLVKDGKAESRDSVQYTRNSAPVIKPAKLYRRIQVEPETECARCGECCRWMVLCDARYLDPMQLSYLIARGGKLSEGLAIIPSECQHLRIDEFDPSRTKCLIYEKRPQICAMACGRKLYGGRKFWIPENCAMRPK